MSAAAHRLPPTVRPARHQWGRELADSAHLLQSPFAAVPSGHVAFALVAGMTFARLGDMAWLRAFGWVYPPLVVAVTVITAHHLVLDAVAAALVVAVAAAAAWSRREHPSMPTDDADRAQIERLLAARSTTRHARSGDSRIAPTS
jgi:membrane-associated phospholipid phosphatase